MNNAAVANDKPKAAHSPTGEPANKPVARTTSETTIQKPALQKAAYSPSTAT